MKINWNREFKIFKDNHPEYVDLTEDEKRELFKPLWEELKASELKQNLEDEEETDYDIEEARSFYLSKIKDRTIIKKDTILELKYHWKNIFGSPLVEDLGCPSCLSRCIRRFYKKIF